MKTQLRLAVSVACFAAAIGETSPAVPLGAQPSFQPRALASAEDTAKCYIDAMKFGPFLAQAGLQIDKATGDCRGDHGTPHACATDILEAVSSVSYTAGFIAAAVEKCGPAPNAKAEKCAENIANLIGAVTGLGVGTSDITKECPAASGWHPYKWVSPEQKGRMVGVCVIDSVQATWNLARAGLMINSAIIECKKGDVADCAARITGVVNSVAAAAAFIVGAVHQCSGGQVHGFACSEAVLKLVSSLSGIATSAIDVHENCGAATTTPRRLLNATGVGEKAHALPKLTAVEVAHLATLNITENEMAADPARIIRALNLEGKHVDVPALLV